MLVIDPNEFDLCDEILQEPVSCRILIVDSVDTDRFQLKKILEALNYKVISFKSDSDLFKVIEEEQPELVFYNIETSVEADEHLLRGIKAIQNEQQVSPYIILTISNDLPLNIESTDQNELYDDISQKPFSETFVNGALNNWKRNIVMQQLLDMQEQRLSEYSSRVGQEMELASNIINNLVREEWLSPGNVKHVQFPMEVLSGDIFLSAFNPGGRQVFLIGDLTGHGLAAAVGAMVVYDVFYSMVQKGFLINQIAKEINSKLRRIQNTGRFMCVCLIELDSKNHFLHVLNAGLPDVLLKGKEKGIKKHYKSDNLPLGILSSDELDLKINRLELDEGDRLYIYTDGLNEVHNDEGDVLGNERIHQLFSEEQTGDNYYDAILNLMYQFHGGGKRTDDITLVEIICDDSLINREHVSLSNRNLKKSSPWAINLDIGAETLKKENPIPMLLQNVNELQGMQSHREHIYTVLAEMFSNALEHGLLGLDSNLKKDADGFAQYYGMREQLLENLKDGKIRLELQNEPQSEGGKLTFAVQDNGQGFDYDAYLCKINKHNNQAHGRGMLLIKNICRDIRYSDRGRRVEADYYWKE